MKLKQKIELAFFAQALANSPDNYRKLITTMQNHCHSNRNVIEVVHFVNERFKMFNRPHNNLSTVRWMTINFLNMHKDKNFRYMGDCLHEALERPQTFRCKISATITMKNDTAATTNSITINEHNIVLK